MRNNRRIAARMNACSENTKYPLISKAIDAIFNRLGRNR